MRWSKNKCNTKISKTRTRLQLNCVTELSLEEKSMSEEYLMMLKKALEGIELTEDEDRIIKWIAGWDLFTVQQFLQIIKKCRS